MSTLHEHGYIDFSKAIMEKSTEKLCSESEKKDTELRLGLPGSHSPERKPVSSSLSVSLFGKELDNSCLGSLKSPVSGAKRGYCDAIDGSSAKWGLAVNGKETAGLFSPRGGNLVNSLGGLENNGSTNGCASASVKKDGVAAAASSAKQVQGAAPAAKAQVVGWPPIRSYRKNSMASNLAKNNSADSDSKSGGCLYVKVSMDGAPYLRKVDLKIYKNYMELSTGLEKMFSCFTIGQCGSTGLPGRDGLTESRLADLLHGSEYVLTYEDKDGDWMLVGDVPWEMFTDTCRRLRIMKGSEAIGLAPRAMEKCKTKN